MSTVHHYRLRCTTESTNVFEWRTEAQGPPTVCPNGSGHAIITDSITIVDEKERKEVLFQGGNFSSNIGDYALVSVPDNGTAYFSFMVPFDFVTPISLDLIVATQTAFTSKIIKIYSDYGALGEPPVNHSESNITKTYTAAANIWSGLDISSIFSSLSANDVCGLKVKPVTLGTDFKSIGIRMIYEVV